MEKQDIRWKQRFQNFDKAFLRLSKANHTEITGQFSPASLPIRVHPRGRFVVASLERPEFDDAHV